MITFKVNEDSIDITDYTGDIRTHIGIDLAFYHITVAQTEAFLESLVKHITYVREAGVKLGVSRQQLKYHDQTKFSTEELPHYVRNFFGDKASNPASVDAWRGETFFNN